MTVRYPIRSSLTYTHFPSNCWYQRLRWRYARRAQLLSIPTPSFPVLALFRTTNGPRSTRLHVISLPISQPRTLVRSSPEMALPNCARKCRSATILALVGRPVTYPYGGAFTPPPPSTEPTLFPMAWEDQLSSVLIARIHHADHPRMATFFAVRISGDARAEGGTELHPYEIPHSGLHDVLPHDAGLFCNTIFFDASLGTEGGAAFWHDDQICRGSHVWEETTGTAYRLACAAGLNVTFS